MNEPATSADPNDRYIVLSEYMYDVLISVLNDAVHEDPKDADVVKLRNICRAATRTDKTAEARAQYQAFLQQVLEYVGKHPGTSARTISIDLLHGTGAPQSSARNKVAKALQHLLHMGKLRRTGDGIGQTPQEWYVVDPCRVTGDGIHDPGVQPGSPTGVACTRCGDVVSADTPLRPSATEDSR